MFFFRMKILHKPLQQKRTEIRECIDPVFVTDVIGRKFESIAYIRIFSESISVFIDFVLPLLAFTSIGINAVAERRKKSASNVESLRL